MRVFLFYFYDVRVQEGQFSFLFFLISCFLERLGQVERGVGEELFQRLQVVSFLVFIYFGVVGELKGFLGGGVQFGYVYGLYYGGWGKRRGVCFRRRCGCFGFGRQVGQCAFQRVCIGFFVFRGFVYILLLGGYRGGFQIY